MRRTSKGKTDQAERVTLDLCSFCALADCEDLMNAKELLAELQTAAGLPLDGHDDAWLHFIDVILKLPRCYLPAAQHVLSQGRWRRLTRRGDNPVGYVKTATQREALKMGLALDRFNDNEPRVPTKDL
jgi:hypothetical protein